MKRSAAFLTPIIIALAVLDAAAATTGGTTLRFQLQPDQVLVYRSVSDVETRIRGRTDGREGRTTADTHIDMVFSLTAGERHADGSTDVTIEILDITMVSDAEMNDRRIRMEMDARGVKIYDGKKLIQESAWGDINLPSGLDFPALLAANLRARMSPRAELEHIEDPERLKRLLQGANFLHLLRCQIVLPEQAITKGSTWDVKQELVMANPLRLKELYKLQGTEKCTALEAVTHMNRRCLKAGVRGDWPKTDVGDGEARARSSATAIVDFETGVTFAISAKSLHRIEGTRGEAEADMESETTSKIEYIGGRKTYEQYKAKKP